MKAYFIISQSCFTELSFIISLYTNRWLWVSTWGVLVVNKTLTGFYICLQIRTHNILLQTAYIYKCYIRGLIGKVLPSPPLRGRSYSESFQGELPCSELNPHFWLLSTQHRKGLPNGWQVHSFSKHEAVKLTKEESMGRGWHKMRAYWRLYIKDMQWQE